MTTQLGDKVVLSVAVYREGGGLQPLGDTFVLDTASGRWCWPEHSGGNFPQPRNAATMDFANGRLVMYGGWEAFVATYNDTWLLRI